jgi:hypothetical protein
VGLLSANSRRFPSTTAFIKVYCRFINHFTKQYGMAKRQLAEFRALDFPNG